MNLVIKDAVWQIIWRAASAILWFIVIKLITPYLGPLRFGDYSTILKFFAIWSAFADFGIYVIALKKLGKIKGKQSWELRIEHWEIDNEEQIIKVNTMKSSSSANQNELELTYGKFVSTRMFMIIIVYVLALIVAYLIPAYTSNPYLIRWIPIGMLFSASFMTAGILQIPVQLFWRMEQLTIALILARVGQLLVIIATIYAFATIEFDGSSRSLLPFVLILSSMLVSWVIQWAYVRWKWQKHLRLRWIRDWSFTKDILKWNRQYGLAYYLSSFHTLIVLVLLSIFFPTIEGYSYAGTRALALALIEILLFIPSALGNSLIHKVSHYSTEEKKVSFGALLQIVFWIGCYVIIMFSWFAPHVIYFIGWEEYLTTASTIWSDYILPFLGIVITLSFIKQVFNYIFVSEDLQNKLLKINLIGVIIGCAVWVPLLLKWNILWGIIMQILLELCFVIWTIWIAWKHKVIPTFSKAQSCTILLGTIWLVVLWTYMIFPSVEQYLLRISIALLSTIALTGISFWWLKRVMKKL